MYGTLEIFERELGESWKTTGSPERIVVGYNGLGWAYAFRDKALSDEPLKLEGDKRTPAGIFPLGPAFGFSASDKTDYVQLTPSETFCVNDPKSPHYNKILPSRMEDKRRRYGERWPVSTGVCYRHSHERSTTQRIMHLPSRVAIIKLPDSWLHRHARKARGSSSGVERQKFNRCCDFTPSRPFTIPRLSCHATPGYSASLKPTSRHLGGFGRYP